MQEIQQKLHKWYHQHKRDLPWRHTTDPYRIWVSEIMLQQTQVAQGLPYYHRFMDRFTSLEELAKAEEDEVLKLWQGLGYYSRARHLHSAAKQVVNEHGGVFPQDYNTLLSLKGVGDYTAAAVSSFSSGELRACIDGNVIRVVCRLFGIDTPYDTGDGKKTIKALADELLSKTDSATHNQAIMEFGALQCTPKNTNCDICPLQNKCIAYAKQQVQILPIKSKKTKVQDLYLYYFLYEQEDKLLIQQRADSGIWRNMYEFPVLESPTKIKKADLLLHLNKSFDNKYSKRREENDKEINILAESKVNIESISFSHIYTHILSHRRIQACFIKVQCKKLPEIPKAQRIKLSELESFPMSRLMERFWEDNSHS